jgi:hypothetical protein
MKGKLNVKQKKDIIKISSELTALENRKIIKNINKTKVGSLKSSIKLINFYLDDQ